MTQPPTTARRLSVPPVAVLAAAAAAQQVLSRRHGQIGPARGLAAAALALASGGLNAGSVREFRRAQTTVNPVAADKATSLVTTGPHRLTRNPMYVGMAGLLLAQSVARGSWSAVLPALGFVVVIDRAQIPTEEAAMAELFGRDYAEYSARVPRWLDIRSSARRKPSA